MNPNFKAGDIVRYDSGCTAVARLISPHSGGWHAEQHFGGVIFVCDKPFRKVHLASKEEAETFIELRQARAEENAPVMMANFIAQASQTPEFRDELKKWMYGNFKELASLDKGDLDDYVKPELTYSLTTVIGDVMLTLDEKPCVIVLEVNHRRVYGARIRVSGCWYTGDGYSVELALKNAAAMFKVGIRTPFYYAFDISLIRKRCY